MAGNIKGIIVEIGGDTSALQNSLKKVNSQSSSLSKELRGVNSLLKLDPNNVELLGQKQTILNENIQTTQTKLNELKKIKEEADKKMAEGTKISEENYRNLQREIINTEKKLGNLTAELKQFNLENSNWTKAGKRIEEYGDKITKASGKINEIGNKASIASGAVVASGTVLANNAMNLEDAVAKYVNTTNTAKEETEKYRQVLENINRNNYGEGYEDIADSMSQVKMQLKDINSQDLQNITEKAIALRDLFGYDVSESIRAVKAMMDNFSISADEAFNLIAEGKKQGLDFSNELLDNVNEYSVQFKKLGLTADDMFNIFKSGAESGAFNLDKIGDAVKEFSIRAIDGSNTTIDGFKRLGLNADTMAKKFAKGGDEAKQAFVEVIQKIAKMDNKVEQSIVGVDLFGTMWEDLGPTVISSFSKMDRGISKSSNSMQESIDGLYNTTKKKAEAQLKRLQSLGADFGKEMLPVLEKLIDKAEDFINCLDGMSDAEKENVVKIGLLVAGMGPFAKAVGTAGQVVGTTAKGVGTLSKAIGVMKDNTESGVASVDKLAKILTGATSPLGLTTMAITATAGALIYFATKETEAQEKAREFAKEVSASKEKLNEYNTSINESINSNVTQINSVKDLKDELLTLVDANGRVKEGYKGRVSYILNELNNALGTEYKLNNNIIQSYKNLQSEIDNTIEKKKAEVILQGEQEKWANWKNEESEATKQLYNATKQLNEAKEEYGTSLEGLRKIAEGSYGKEKEYLQNVINTYDESVEKIKTGEGLKKQYETDYALFVEGKYNEMGKTIISTTSNWTKGSLDTLQKGIKEQSDELKVLKSNYETTGNEIIKNQKEQTEQNLRDLAQNLADRTSTVKTLGIEEYYAWKTLAEENYRIYSEELQKMKPEMRVRIEELTGYLQGDTSVPAGMEMMVKRTTSKFEEKMKVLTTNTQVSLKNVETEINKNTGIENSLYLLSERGANNFEKKLDLDGSANRKLSSTASTILNNTSVKNSAGNLAQNANYEFKKYINAEKGNSATKDYMQGAENGANQKKKSFWSLLFGIGRRGNQNMRDGLGDGSPSVLAKTALIDYFLGADIGIKKQAPKTLSEIGKYGKKINEEFAKNMRFSEIQDLEKMQGGLNRQIINNTRTIFTTPQINFNVQELDEAKLQQCFNYVNKKFGSHY